MKQNFFFFQIVSAVFNFTNINLSIFGVYVTRENTDLHNRAVPVICGCGSQFAEFWPSSRPILGGHVCGVPGAVSVVSHVNWHAV